jgi:hypothetical protein
MSKSAHLRLAASSGRQPSLAAPVRPVTRESVYLLAGPYHGDVLQTRTLLTSIAGVAPLSAAALWFFVVGGGWSGVWLLAAGIALLLRGPARRHWARADRDNTGSSLLQGFWYLVGLTLVVAVLGITQLFGIGFRQDANRGALALLGVPVGLFCAFMTLRQYRDARSRRRHSA